MHESVSSNNLLYRGVSLNHYKKCEGKLCPKEFVPFVKSPTYGHSEWGNAFCGENSANAVIEQQLHQAGYATSGISTTPHIERAKFYATHGGTLNAGYVYVIDRSLCQKYSVSVYEVATIVPHPSIPEDEEVVLVAKEYGCLPKEIVVEIQEIII